MPALSCIDYYLGHLQPLPKRTLARGLLVLQSGLPFTVAFIMMNSSINIPLIDAFG